MTKLTIKEIAQKAGISTATVSRAINKPETVAEKTRHKIMAILKKYDYSPNHFARGLVSGKSRILSLVTPHKGNFFNAFYFRETFLGITVYAAGRGYNVLIEQPLNKSSDSARGQLPVDGYIVVSPVLDDPFVKRLEKGESPAVLINMRSELLNWVDLDNNGSVEEALNYLIDRGHSRIVAIAGRKNIRNSRDRLKSYKNVLKSRDIEFNPEYVLYGDFNEGKTYFEMKNFLGKDNRATAVFAFNDLMAIGAMKAIRESGKKIPEDISVIGFDDMPPASYISPPLTTVKQPFYKMGFQAVKFLIDQIEGSSEKPSHCEFSGELIIRQSSGPA